MGQALRGATGRVRTARKEPHAAVAKKPDRRPEAGAPPTPVVRMDGQDRVDIDDADVAAKTAHSNSILEERDQNYDDMLRHMVGRITSRPGGKNEMGEAFIVEKDYRPMPKLRTSRTEAGGTNGQIPLPPGTLNAEQVRQIILLHQGESNDHQGPMDVKTIAERFRIDAMHVEQIVQFLSLPPKEDGNQKAQT